MLDFDTADKGPLDIVGLVTCVLALVGVGLVGLYGLSANFIESRAYLDANIWVMLLSGVLGGGCGLYMWLELGGFIDRKHLATICVVAAVLSIFAVAKGVPALVTKSVGKPTEATFTVTGAGLPSRHCRRPIDAKNDNYELYSTCWGTRYSGPQVGDTLTVSGIGSNWGLLVQSVQVR